MLTPFFEITIFVFSNVQIRAYGFLLSPREYPIGPVARKNQEKFGVYEIFNRLLFCREEEFTKFFPIWFSRVSLKQLAVRERPGDEVWGWLLDLNWSEHHSATTDFRKCFLFFFCNNFAKSNLEKKIHISIQSNIPFSANPFPENFAKIWTHQVV